MEGSSNSMVESSQKPQDVDQSASGDARTRNIFWGKCGGRHVLMATQFSSDCPQNPFLFQLEPHLRGNVGLAAEQLSGDILASRLCLSLHD
jgi:hypothetical protein